MIILSERYMVDMKKAEREGLRTNVLCIGGSGKGKTDQFIMPNIVESQDDFIVFDADGELCREYNSLFGDDSTNKFSQCFVIGDDDLFRSDLWNGSNPDNSIRNLSHPIECKELNYNVGRINFIQFSLLHKGEVARAVDLVLKDIVGSPLNRQTDIIIDEFANIGRIPDFADDLEKLHKTSPNISVIMAVNSISQIYKLYGETDGARIIDSCGVQIHMGGYDPADAGMSELSDDMCCIRLFDNEVLTDRKHFTMRAP